MTKVKILSIILVAYGVYRFGYNSIFNEDAISTSLNMIIGLLIVWLGLWLNKAYRKGISK